MDNKKKRGPLHQLPEARRKISLAVSKRQMGNKIWLGRKHTEATKQKLRENAIKRGYAPPNRQGTKLPPQHRENIRLSKLGNKNPNFGKPRTIATRIKIGLVQKGDKNHNWRGGLEDINQVIRHSLEYKLWRESVFKRDKYTCIWCGQYGGRLNADHIKPFSLFPELRFAIDNGRTLCEPCHRTTDTYGNRKKDAKQN